MYKALDSWMVCPCHDQRLFRKHICIFLYPSFSYLFVSFARFKYHFRPVDYIVHKHTSNQLLHCAIRSILPNRYARLPVSLLPRFLSSLVSLFHTFPAFLFPRLSFFNPCSALKNCLSVSAVPLCIQHQKQIKAKTYSSLRGEFSPKEGPKNLWSTFLPSFFPSDFPIHSSSHPNPSPPPLSTHPLILPFGVSHPLILPLIPTPSTRSLVPSHSSTPLPPPRIRTSYSIPPSPVPSPSSTDSSLPLLQRNPSTLHPFIPSFPTHLTPHPFSISSYNPLSLPFPSYLLIQPFPCPIDPSSPSSLP